MEFFDKYNPYMDISTRISTNLKLWMAQRDDLNTDKKVEAKSGIGSSTVQRARTGNANVTVKSLEAIAEAFKRPATDLLSAPEPLKTKEPEPDDYLPTKEHPAIDEVTKLMRTMDDIGKGMLLERAEIIAEKRSIINKENAA